MKNLKMTNKLFLEQYRKSCFAICSMCGTYCYACDNFNCNYCGTDYQKSWTIINPFNKHKILK